ncbi:NUDIX hydrolase [Vallitalea okinawensis]|uniref:NUDIX hydrolase n=1 Tax=Vallitalea okinawensis TaxID=2078660 RepID=UPI000CFB2336|nr:NUDIX domain-containing protein [Vallitalea okinawensis]
MKLINKLTDADFNGGKRTYLNKVSRFASRGILFDKDFNVAMIHMSRNGCYKLPGGGIEKNETRRDAFLREIREETGYSAKVIDELGYIEEHKLRNKFMQRSYCYVAKAGLHKSNIMLSNNEKKLGFEVAWMPLDEALIAMKNSLEICNEYTMNFMLLRDKLIVEEAKKWLKRTNNNIK